MALVKFAAKDDFLRAFAEAVLSERFGPRLPVTPELLSAFKQQLMSMPDIFAPGVVVLQRVFVVYASAVGSTPFELQTVEQRSKAIRKWRQSRLAPLRDFVRLFESLTVLGYVSST